jgi:predicted alpha-1,2-mannosidase
MKPFLRNLIWLLLACSIGCRKAEIAPVERINPMVGTDATGHTFPGATVPFGMVQLSPDTRLDTWEGCSGYHYGDSLIYGFSHTHLSGTGCLDYGDILVMPSVGTPAVLNTQYASAFRHETETARAGYYSVQLDKDTILAELTASPRVGFHRYTFPAAETANILIDLEHRDEVLAASLEFRHDTICGMRTSRSWAREQTVFFAAVFSKPTLRKTIFVNNEAAPRQVRATGTSLKAVAAFATEAGEAIEVKVALSPVGIDGALKNLRAEGSGVDFAAAHHSAREAWNRELEKITVEGGTEEQRKVFYTAMYHSMIAPNLYTDVDGQYRGRDLEVHVAEGFDCYTVFSLWDTYRTLHPLYTIIDQKRTGDYINTFLAQYQQGGLLPMWELSANETDCMIGYHAVSVLADAYLKGIRGYDTTLALQAMLASAHSGKYGLDAFVQYGAVPGEMEHESVSKTLEYAYDDWCIAQVAKQQGRDDIYRTFIRRAQYYTNLYNPATGFLQPRNNGRFLTSFDPAEVSLHYTEANGWQYGQYVPQDITGLYTLMGGKDSLERMLDRMFDESQTLSGRHQVDITGLIGQYAHGNEPSHHVAYLYNYVNKPWKTQQMVRRIMNEMYSSQPDGNCGNNDCGQMSAWYIMSALGFYPVCPGDNRYIIGSPLFDKATIRLENGKTFTIRAKNQGPKNVYIRSATLNGQPFTQSYLMHETLMNGGELVFTLGSSPNTRWGSSDTDIPVATITDHLITLIPEIRYEGLVSFSGTKQIRLHSPQPEAIIYYTLDGQQPTEKSLRYEAPFDISRSCTLQAVAVVNGQASFPAIAEFYKIPAGRSVSVNATVHPQYTAGGPEALIDHVRGKRNWRLGLWQGYARSQDVEVTVDLGKREQLQYIGAGFLHDVRSWIVYPTQVEFSGSDDGLHFTPLRTIKNKISFDDTLLQMDEWGFRTNIRTRYIRMVARSAGHLPAWHPGAGDPSFIFLDEIIIR